MHETWYVLEDGSAADPSEVSPDAKGVMKHKDGRLVQMRGDVPRSRSVDVEKEMARASQKKSGGFGGGMKIEQPKDMQAASPKRTYQTRTFKSASEPEPPLEKQSDSEAKKGD